MKVIIYYEKCPEHKETALWYAKEFFNPTDNACIIASPYAGLPKSMHYFQGANAIDRLFFFLEGRNIDPVQCEFHFIFEKRAGSALPIFTNDGYAVCYRDLFDLEKIKDNLYIGVRSSNRKAIIKDHIITETQICDFATLEGIAADSNNCRRELGLFQSIPQSTDIVEYCIEKSIHEEIEDLIQAKITKLSSNVLAESSTISDALKTLSAAIKEDTSKHPSDVIVKWEKDHAELLNKERPWLASFTGQTNLKKFIDLLKRSYPLASSSLDAQFASGVSGYRSI